LIVEFVANINIVILFIYYKNHFNFYIKLPLIEYSSAGGPLIKTIQISNYLLLTKYLYFFQFCDLLLKFFHKIFS